MARGGKREGAGRKGGAVSQAKRDLAEMAKEHAETALNVLVSVAQTGESEGARVSAANAILDRAYGKPPQALEHTGKNGGPIEHKDVSARDILNGKLARLASRSGTGGDAGKPDGSAD